VRTRLPDRPGSLAHLARGCGDAGVNILGLQIFPGIDAVTDELVLSAPDHWTERDVETLVAGSGGRSTAVRPCTEAALADQATRYVEAARTILADPAAFPSVAARLFDAEPVVGATTAGDVMDMSLGEVTVQVGRAAPFTATEHARGAALAALVGDVLGRQHAAATSPGAAPDAHAGPLTVGATGRRVGGGVAPAYVVTGDAVRAEVDGPAVGVAHLRPAAGDPAVRGVTLRVDAAWQRRGIGTRLLVAVARLAAGSGAAELVLSTRADNRAVLPLVLGAGLRARIRMASDTLTVRVPVRDLAPLRG
jgi:GNAT superfamily N-acetyltransferase